MDPGQLKLFHVMKERMDWLAQRQKVLAQNIANADTGDFEARDLAPQDFRKLVQKEATATRLTLAETSASHLKGQNTANQFRYANRHEQYETTPTGNAVTLEEQMLKMSETREQYKLTTQLYKKYATMFKLAAKGPGG
jgi:flagellar basal-body rod protein FlgB